MEMKEKFSTVNHEFFLHFQNYKLFKKLLKFEIYRA